MDKQSFNELLAAARSASLEENRVCIEFERKWLQDDRGHVNELMGSISWREQLIANMEDIVAAKERAAEQAVAALLESEA